MSTTKHGEKTFHIKSFGIGTFSTNDIMFSECFLQLDSKQILESKYKIVAKTSRRTVPIQGRFISGDILAGAYCEPCKTLMMVLFAEILNRQKPLSNLAKKPSIC